MNIISKQNMEAAFENTPFRGYLGETPIARKYRERLQMAAKTLIEDGEVWGTHNIREGLVLIFGGERLPTRTTGPAPSGHYEHGVKW